MSLFINKENINFYHLKIYLMQVNAKRELKELLIVPKGLSFVNNLFWITFDSSAEWITWTLHAVELICHSFWVNVLVWLLNSKVEFYTHTLANLCFNILKTAALIDKPHSNLKFIIVDKWDNVSRYQLSLEMINFNPALLID